MYQAVVSVQPNKDFSLAVVFENGAQGLRELNLSFKTKAIQEASRR